MHIIVYVSDYNGQNTDIGYDLENIVAVSKVRNREQAITGVLFYHNRKFMQLIEGEHSVLNALMNKLRGDPRHRNITIIVDETVERRGFAEWNMDAFNLSQEETLDVAALRKIRDIYKANVLPMSNTLIDTYKYFLEHRLLQRG